MTLLIFDCDGVLVDSEVIANAVLAELITSLGHPTTVDDSIQTYTGRSLKDVLAIAETLLGRPIPQDTADDYRRRLFDRFRRELAPVEGVQAAIAALPHRRCVASSSAPERLSLALEVAGLAPLFGNSVYSAVQVPRGKPAPDLFLHAARAMGEPPADCIVIEDSPLGVEAAIAGGMRVIGFTGGSHADTDLAKRLTVTGAHTIVAAMRDLPAAVESLVTNAIAHAPPRIM
jgi:HAD superfamily hydrolase (TIGR01509 family)